MVSDVNLVTFTFFAVLGVRVGRVAQVLAARSIKTTSDLAPAVNRQPSYRRGDSYEHL